MFKNWIGSKKLLIQIVVDIHCIVPLQTKYYFLQKMMQNSANSVNVFVLLVANRHIIIAITLALAIVSNFILMFVILRGNYVAKMSASPIQRLVLHTCAADMLFALFSSVSRVSAGFITLQIFSPIFKYLPPFCPLLRCAYFLSQCAGGFLLVAISFDRYQVNSDMLFVLNLILK